VQLPGLDLVSDGFDGDGAHPPLRLSVEVVLHLRAQS
jgi:hypothetical protein